MTLSGSIPPNDFILKYKFYITYSQTQFDKIIYQFNNWDFMNHSCHDFLNSLSVYELHILIGHMIVKSELHIYELIHCSTAIFANPNFHHDILPTNLQDTKIIIHNLKDYYDEYGNIYTKLIINNFTDKQIFNL